MKTIRKLPDGRWVIVRRPLERRIGLALLGSAAILTLLTIVVMLNDGDVAYLWFQVLALAVAGGFYFRTNPRVVVDAEVGSIDLGHGPERGRQFAAVRLGSQLRHQRDQEVRLYSVDLTRLEAGPESKADLSITLTTSEAEAWKIAELLARAFDLPMLDSTDGHLTQRAPTQLDQPLGERLANDDLPPGDPGPAPPGMSQDASPGRLRVAWHVSMARPLAALVVLAGTFAASIWVALDFEIPWLGWGLAAFMVGLGIVVASASRGHGGNVLEISAGVLHHTTRFPYPHTTSVPVQRIEHLRDQSRPSPTISLVSDDGVVVLQGTDRQCHWLRRKLEHWLAAHSMTAR